MYRIMILLFLSASVLFISVTPDLTGVPSYKKLLPVHSKKCLDVAGASLQNGAEVLQWSCHGGDNQKWFVEIQKPRQSRHLIVAIRSKKSGKCLDVYGGQAQNGARVIQWDCHYGDNQLWEIVRVKNSKRLAMLKSVHSGRCLDVSGVSTNDGAKIIIWDCHGGGNQVWYALK